MHKGGPNTGLFIQITSDYDRDIEIPGLPYGFGNLIKAQALGDYNALLAHKCRIIRLHLSKDITEDLKVLLKIIRSIDT